MANTGHHFSIHALSQGSHPACIDASNGQVLTYAALDQRTNQAAHLFRELGLKAGDGVVIFCQNHPRYYELIWAAHRAGLYYTPVSWHSKAQEIAYIIENSNAKVFIASSRFEDEAIKTKALLDPSVRCLSVFSKLDGFDTFEQRCETQPQTPIADQASGREMLYTSGTTGKPKGVKFPLNGKAIDYAPSDDMALAAEYANQPVVMAPGPLYHASPLLSTRSAHRFGGTVVVIDKFDAQETLQYIQDYKVTHMVCVPTHFLRLLSLPKEVRESYDCSSLQMIMHTGAPCPKETKYAIIDWFGPIVIEIYAGTERVGGTMITSQEWLAHPGSIGRVSVGSAHVVDEATWEEVPIGETGVIYFDSGEKFEYHGDAEKTNSMYSPQGWRTMGDIGRMDEDGYIYLTDRKSNMIITGGVNVYPQESENRLITHPKVADVAVFGIPNLSFGEEVKAVVQLSSGESASEELELELIDYCKEVLAAVKCPRSIDFAQSLPREDNGKLYKKKLIERYAELASQTA